MASSSTPMNIVMITLCLLLSTTGSAASSIDIIQNACINSTETNLCVQVLESDPHVRSATNLFDLCTSIIDFAISNSTSVHTHILELLKDSKDPNLTKTLKDCESGYEYTIESLASAVGEIRDRNPSDLYQTASYDLFVSGDGITMCEGAVASSKTGDEIIQKGNEIAGILRLSAIHLVDDILSKSVAYPPSFIYGTK